VHILLGRGLSPTAIARLIGYRDGYSLRRACLQRLAMLPKGDRERFARLEGNDSPAKDSPDGNDFRELHSAESNQKQQI
jgi:hypothetical protein